LPYRNRTVSVAYTLAVVAVDSSKPH